MQKSIFTILLILIWSQVSAASLHKDSILLAKCEFIYTYTAQLLQLKNNIGASNNMLRRASLVGVANMMLNQELGIIAAWKIEKFSSIRAPLKNQFDSNKLSAIDAASDCDRAAIQIASNARKTSTTLWGKSFDELQDLWFAKLKTSLGLP